MTIAIERCLTDIELFRGLGAEAIRVLATARSRRFRRGETLWSAGAEPRGLMVILAGRVRVVRAPRGRQFGVHTEGPGGTLGEVPFFAGGSYPATAIATEPTTCLVLDRVTLELAVTADPDLAFRWLSRLAERVRRLVDRLDQQTGSTVEQRLAGMLLARHEETGGKPFMLAATQAEAAEELGTVREVVVRELRRLRECGVVETKVRGHYRVVDKKRLRELSVA